MNHSYINQYILWDDPDIALSFNFSARKTSDSMARPLVFCAVLIKEQASQNNIFSIDYILLSKVLYFHELLPRCRSSDTLDTGYLPQHRSHQLSSGIGRRVIRSLRSTPGMSDTASSTTAAWKILATRQLEVATSRCRSLRWFKLSLSFTLAPKVGFTLQKQISRSSLEHPSTEYNWFGWHGKASNFP